MLNSWADISRKKLKGTPASNGRKILPMSEISVGRPLRTRSNDSSVHNTIHKDRFTRSPIQRYFSLCSDLNFSSLSVLVYKLMSFGSSTSVRVATYHQKKIQPKFGDLDIGFQRFTPNFPENGLSSLDIPDIHSHHSVQRGPSPPPKAISPTLDLASMGQAFGRVGGSHPPIPL